MTGHRLLAAAEPPMLLPRRGWGTKSSDWKLIRRHVRDVKGKKQKENGKGNGLEEYVFLDTV